GIAAASFWRRRRVFGWPASGATRSARACARLGLATITSHIARGSMDPSSFRAERRAAPQEKGCRIRFANPTSARHVSGRQVGSVYALLAHSQLMPVDAFPTWRILADAAQESGTRVHG